MSLLKSILFVVCLVSVPVSKSELMYVVVLNGEFTLTAVTTFLFESVPGENLKFLNLYEDEVTPGLLSYANATEECIPGLKRLVTNAQTMTPVSERKSSPLMLIATTGLRLLPEKQYHELVHTIESYFKTTGLRIDNDSVSLMEGRKRIFTWLTINLILGRLQSKASGTVALIDLGTTTNDLAFAPDWDDRVPLWRWKLVVNLTAFDNRFEVYSYSYFRLGINEARVQILKQDRKEGTTNVYESECISNLAKITWTYNRKVYNITGVSHCRKTPGSVSKKACLQRINAVLDKYERSVSLEGKELYARAYFYRLALDAGMVQRELNANVTVDDFFHKAKVFCKNGLKNRPFICMDLLYVNSLLTRIYGLTNRTIIRLVWKMDRHEVNWPLGAAFEKYQEEVNNIGQIVEKPNWM